jgi:hypothetical protein
LGVCLLCEEGSPAEEGACSMRGDYGK